MAASLNKGWDEAVPARERATALFQAALITRTNGIELTGTEVAPDWNYHAGNFEYGVTAELRASEGFAEFLRPSSEELARYASHPPDPDGRFHYRYQAASLAWEAARLLPDDDDFTAYVLWQGGGFVKHRDPDFADVFYKALVRRNRNTALGAEADRQRWFPTIDSEGNVVTRSNGPVHAEESFEAKPLSEDITDEMVPAAAVEASESAGNHYVVRRGDTLIHIANAFSAAGVRVTPSEIRAANPDMETSRLKVGQVLFIPSPASTEDPNTAEPQ